MSPTTQAFLAALIGAVVAGGAVLAWHVSERQQAGVRPPEEPAVPAGAAAVLSVLRSSAVVVDDEDEVVKASAPALAFGLVRGNRLLSQELADMVQQVRRDGQIRETELTMPRPSGPPRTVTARVAPLSSRYVLALVEDRTRERRVEAVRRDFVANVSHELKTPVGALTLLAEAVQDAADDPEAIRRFAGRMQHEGTRLGRLVAELIELSRLQGAEPLPSPAVVDVDRIVAEAVDRTRLAAESAGIAVVSGGQSRLRVRGNEGQLVTALVNLVDNAIAYSPAGTRVAVGTRRRDGYVEISVSDQGIGVAERDLERVFERFYRSDPARSRATGGTGLGLAIVKHIATNHGGGVSVWSVEGSGSTFTLRLPVAGSDLDRPPDDDDEAASAPAETVRAGAPDQRGTP